MRNPFRREKQVDDSVSQELRQAAFDVTAEEINLTASPEFPQVWGAIMEDGMAPGGFTMVCFAEGSTGLYFFPTGTIIGPQHPAISAAAQEIIREAQICAESLPVVGAVGRPGPDELRLVVRTFTGNRSVIAPRKAMLSPGHPAADLVQRCQILLQAIMAHG